MAIHSAIEFVRLFDAAMACPLLEIERLRRMRLHGPTLVFASALRPRAFLAFINC
jgi:hypothetical protein